MALSFNETDQYLSIADNAALTLPDGDWTIGLWVRLPSNTGTIYKYFMSVNLYGQNPAMYWFFYEGQHVSAANKLSFYFRDNDGTEVAASSTITPGANTAWQHLILQRSGDAITQYVDGVASGTASSANLDALDANTPLYLGCRSDLLVTGFFGGHMAHFAIWGRALSAAERAALAAGHSPGEFGEDMRCWLPMEADAVEVFAGLTVTDNSGGLVTGPTITEDYQFLYDGFRSFWPLDDLASSDSFAWDHGPAMNHGTNYNGVTPGDGCAVFGGSAYFQHNVGPCPTLYEGDEFTFACDVYLDSLAASEAFIGQFDSNVTRMLSLYGATDKIVARVSANGSDYTQATSDATIAIQTWYRLVFWCDGTNVGVRVNTIENTAAFSSAVWYSSSLATFRLGGSGQTGGLNGRMRNVMYWARGLTQAERAILYQGWQPETDEPDALNLVLVFGQSNASGNADSTTLVNPAKEAYRFAVPVYGTAPGDGWKPTFPGQLGTTNFGPEVGMAQVLGRGWAIHVHGPGSTGVHPDLNEWYPGDAVYNAAVAAVTKARAELTAVGIASHVRAICWVQGEEDAGTQSYAESWATNAAAVFDALRALYGPVPIVVCRMHASQDRTYIDTVIAQQDALAASYPNLTLVDTSDWLTLNDDVLHFDADSQLRLGREMGRAVLEKTERRVPVLV